MLWENKNEWLHPVAALSFIQNRTQQLMRKGREQSYHFWEKSKQILIANNFHPMPCCELERNTTEEKATIYSHRIINAEEQTFRMKPNHQRSTISAAPKPLNHHPAPDPGTS